MKRPASSLNESAVELLEQFMNQIKQLSEKDRKTFHDRVMEGVRADLVARGIKPQSEPVC